MTQPIIVIQEVKQIHRTFVESIFHYTSAGFFISIFWNIIYYFKFGKALNQRVQCARNFARYVHSVGHEGHYTFSQRRENEWRKPFPKREKAQWFDKYLTNK